MQISVNQYNHNLYIEINIHTYIYSMNRCYEKLLRYHLQLTPTCRSTHTSFDAKRTILLFFLSKLIILYRI
ncbi:unnamed protein product [Auanema sp. JU1783]|nr:unnamed protein product [Auanema sp. JU1783]